MRKFIFSTMICFLGFFVSAQEQEVRYNQYGVAVTRQKLQAEERNGILVFESLDQSYRFWFDIRIQFDGAVFWGLDKGLYEDSKSNKVANGVSFRRVRFAIKSQINENWYGEIDTDFANGEFELKDAIIEFTGLEDFSFKAGNFKEDFSMSQTTSSRYLPFMERPMVVSAFAPSRHVGFQAEYAKGWWRASFGTFFQIAESLETSTYYKDNNKAGKGGGVSYTAKANFMPMKKDRSAGLHFGAAMSRRTPKTDVSTSNYKSDRFDVRSGTSINRKKYLDTDRIRNARYDFLYGFELAGFQNGFRFQSEFIGNNTRTHKAGHNDFVGTYHFRGWYAMAGYLLFGGQQRYNNGEGEFTQPSRGRKWGDLELLARYDYLDLNSRNVYGGSGENYTVGLNFYVNSNVKFVLNYQYTNNDRYANGRGDYNVGYDINGKATSDYTKLADGKGKAGVSYNMLGLRMEIDF